MKATRTISLLAALTLITVIFATACGDDRTSQRPTRLAVATGGTAGVYFPLGGAFANIINEKVSDVTANAESTGASVENVNLLNNGDVDFATIQNDISYYAFTGTEMFSDVAAMTNLRGVATLYPEVVQIITLDSNITSVEDLRGRRVAVGAPGSGVEANARQVLAAHGIGYNDIRADYLSFAEAADALKDGNVEAAFLTAGTPTAAVTDLSTTHSVRIVPIDPAVAQRLIADFPFYNQVSIPAGTYRNQSDDVETVAVMAMLTVRKGLDDDLVYNITKALFENLDMLAAAHSRGGDVMLETAKDGMSLELHPGAARYYSEMGL